MLRALGQLLLAAVLCSQLPAPVAGRVASSIVEAQGGSTRGPQLDGVDPAAGRKLLVRVSSDLQQGSLRTLLVDDVAAPPSDDMASPPMSAEVAAIVPSIRIVDSVASPDVTQPDEAAEGDEGEQDAEGGEAPEGAKGSEGAEGTEGADSNGASAPDYAQAPPRESADEFGYVEEVVVLEDDGMAGPSAEQAEGDWWQRLSTRDKVGLGVGLGTILVAVCGFTVSCIRASRQEMREPREKSMTAGGQARGVARQDTSRDARKGTLQEVKQDSWQEIWLDTRPYTRNVTWPRSPGSQREEAAFQAPERSLETKHVGESRMATGGEGEWVTPRTYESFESPFKAVSLQSVQSRQLSLTLNLSLPPIRTRPC